MAERRGPYNKSVERLNLQLGIMQAMRGVQPCADEVVDEHLMTSFDDRSRQVPESRAYQTARRLCGECPVVGLCAEFAELEPRMDRAGKVFAGILFRTVGAESLETGERFLTHEDALSWVRAGLEAEE